MKAKTLLIIGLGVGYVLGARAGRERYEQIRAKATELWENPAVVRRRREAASYAREQAPVIRAKVESAAKAAPGVVADGAKTVAAAATEAADATADVARTVAAKTASTTRDAVDKTVSTAKDVANSVSSTARDLVDKVSGKSRRVAHDDSKTASTTTPGS